MGCGNYYRWLTRSQRFEAEAQQDEALGRKPINPLDRREIDRADDDRARELMERYKE
jgi:hypothetical protein